MMTETVTKALKKMPKADRAAHALVLAYVVFRALTRGEERASAVQQLAMDMG